MKFDVSVGWDNLVHFVCYRLSEAGGCPEALGAMNYLRLPSNIFGSRRSQFVSDFYLYNGGCVIFW